MNQARKEKLEKQIAKGKWSYVLRYGVILFGTFMAVWMSGLDLVLDNEPFWSNFQQRILTYPLIGFFTGLFMWKSVNKEYKKLTNQNHHAEA